MIIFTHFIYVLVFTHKILNIHRLNSYKLMPFLISECCMSCHALCFWMNVCRAAVACFSWMRGCSLLWPIIPWSALTALHLTPYPASTAPWSHDHLIYQSREVDLGNVLFSVMRQRDCLMTSMCLAVLVPLWSLLLPVLK